MNSIDQNCAILFEQQARRTPDSIALIEADASITFGELWQRSEQLAIQFQQRGVKPGDRLLVMVPMSFELYTVLLAVISVGAVAVFVDPWVTARTIARIAAFADPVGFIGTPKSHILRLFEPKLRSLRITFTTGATFLSIPARWSIESSSTRPFQPVAVSANDTALITFTGGSSGIPKGANRMHGFLTAQYNAICRELTYPESGADLCMFPVFALRNLAAGKTTVIPSIDFKKVSHCSGELLANQMVRHGVTSITASPPLIDRVVEFYEKRGDSLPKLTIFTGGAPVTDQQLERWYRCGNESDISVVYGSTEAEPVAHIDGKERLSLDSREGFCCGEITPLLQAKVIRISHDPISEDQFDSQILPTGEIGELVVAGNHVCTDYFRNPEAVVMNKIIDKEGTIWHRMGDTGFFDSENRFFLTGRVHSTIDRKGTIVHAQIAEQAVMAIVPSAKRVAAVEIERQLVIVIQGAATPQQIAQIDADRVICTKKELPLDPRHNAKVDYETLRTMVVLKRL